MTTERGRYRFRVAEYADGTWWITTDPLYKTDRLKVLGQHGFIGFDLKPGADHEQAQHIARYLNEHIAFITCTV